MFAKQNRGGRGAGNYPSPRRPKRQVCCPLQATDTQKYAKRKQAHFLIMPTTLSGSKQENAAKPGAAALD
jgi:hypothetical protein